MGVSRAQLLLRSARAHPDRAALALGGTVIASYARLAARVAALAGGLRSRFGLDSGDRVALVMRNCPQYVETLFACWHAGLAGVPINAKLHPKELEFILSDSGARACFVTAEHGDAVSSLSGNMPALAHV
jgi:long-chain acyl-CoA synthetase